MKIGIISDLHLPHWKKYIGALDNIRDSIQKSIEVEKPDLIIDAGDCEIPNLLKQWLGDTPLFIIKGNHDWYGKLWNQKVAKEVEYLNIDNVKILGCTLWTNCNNKDPLTLGLVDWNLVDSTHIYNFNAAKACTVHDYHKQKIEEKAGENDIIVTHHCPSFQSVHENYKKSYGTDLYLVNYGFSSHLDDTVEKSGAKYWVCGHTHWKHSYKIGETEVICNPLGYPGENEGYPENYVPVYVEI